MDPMVLPSEFVRDTDLIEGRQIILKPLAEFTESETESGSEVTETEPDGDELLVEEESEDEVDSESGTDEDVGVDVGVTPVKATNPKMRSVQKTPQMFSSKDADGDEDDDADSSTSDDSDEETTPTKAKLSKLHNNSTLLQGSGRIDNQQFARLIPGAVNVSAGYEPQSNKRKALATLHNSTKRLRSNHRVPDTEHDGDNKVTQQDLEELENTICNDQEDRFDEIKDLINYQCETKIKENIHAALKEAGVYNHGELTDGHAPQYEWPVLPEQRAFRKMNTEQQSTVLEEYANSLQVSAAIIKAQAVPVSKVFPFVDYVRMHMRKAEKNMKTVSGEMNDVFQAHAEMRADLDRVDERLHMLTTLREDVARVEDTMRTLESGSLGVVKKLANNSVRKSPSTASLRGD